MQQMLSYLTLIITAFAVHAAEKSKERQWIWSKLIVQWIHPIQLLLDDPVLFKQFCVFDEGVTITKDEIKVFKFLMHNQPDHCDWYFETDLSKVLKDYSVWDPAQSKHVIKTNFMSLIHPLQLLFDPSNDYQLFRDNVEARQRYLVDWQTNEFEFKDDKIPTDGIKKLDFVKNVLYTKHEKAGSENHHPIADGSETCAFVKMHQLFVYNGWNKQTNKHMIEVSGDEMDSKGEYGYAIWENDATLDKAKLSALPEYFPSLTLRRGDGVIGPPADQLVIDLLQMQDHPNCKELEIDGRYVIKIERFPPNLSELVIRNGRGMRIEFIGTMSHVKRIQKHPQFKQLRRFKVFQ
eukprot:294452_1